MSAAKWKTISIPCIICLQKYGSRISPHTTSRPGWVIPSSHPQLLKELYDVDTIETHGLGLDDKTLELIKEASKTRGVIVLTDPDYPGLRIRNQVEKYVQNCKHAFVDRKDAIGKKKLGIAEANKEAVKKAIENVVTFSNQEESISWKEFLELDIIGDKKKRLKVYYLFHLGYGNAKTLFKRLNMVGISREMIEKELENEGYSD